MQRRLALAFLLLARPAVSAEERPAVVCLGTSLTAGLGVDPRQAWPALLQQRIDAEGMPFRVVAAGVSGETSAGALRRIDWVLARRPAVLLVETGANDGLRGLDVAATRRNVDDLLGKAGGLRPAPRILLCAMEAPPNYGPEYTRDFRSIFPELARRHHVELVPFLLAGVAGLPALNQDDGIHPNAAGHRKVAQNVWPALRGVLAGLR